MVRAHPDSARDRAVARPIPLAPPVMTATRSTTVHAPQHAQKLQEERLSAAGRNYGDVCRSPGPPLGRLAPAPTLSGGYPMPAPPPPPARAPPTPRPRP